jgi:hypothetical protein
MSFGNYVGAGSGITKGLYHLTGNSNDSSGNGNNAVGDYGGVAYSLSSGKFGQGASFTTANPSYIYLPDGVHLPGVFTIAMWIKPSTITPTHAVAFMYTEEGSGETNINLYQNNATLSMKVGNSNGQWDAEFSGGTLVANQWHSTVFTRNGTLHKIYLNGVEVATQTGNYSGGTDNACHQQIGSDTAHSAGWGFGGSIDEVILENVAWSAAAVRKYYTFTRGMFGVQ